MGIRVLTVCHVLVLSLAAQYTSAVTFRASIEQSQWDLESSPFFCRLRQVVPSFGLASFVHEAGERAYFELSPTHKGAYKGRVKLVAEASPWQPGTAPAVIGQVDVDAQSGKILAKPDYASQMLASLYKGMSPTFTMLNWLGTGQDVRVALSSANFQRTYKDYITCVDNLLPVNYRQVARTAVLFPPAQWRLSDATKERLDTIAQYVKTDKQVTSIYVDGHSDNAGRRLLNRDLSKQRAEEVTRYLVTQGIDEDMLTTRYHGERYPVVANNSKANRARNRRVTVRLERD